MQRPLNALILLLLGGACAGQTTAGTPLPRLPRSELLGQTLNQARWQAPLVDTIVVQVARLDLRVGQLVTLSQALLAEGRTAPGQPVPGFFPVFLIETNGGVVELTERGLRAIGLGNAALIVLPLVVPRGRWVATRVPITVR